MSQGFKVFIGRNFKPTGLYDLPSEEYLNQPGVFYDGRNQIITTDWDTSNWEWYYNYLDFAQTLAHKNKNPRPTWLLDLGYIPVVYFPSCCTSKGAELFVKLDELKIPYVKLPPYSFIQSYTNGLQADGWVSKMDVYERLGVPPEKITSEKLLRELVLK